MSPELIDEEPDNTNVFSEEEIENGRPIPPAEPTPINKDKDREAFDSRLTATITHKNLEIIELRIALARADEARRSYLNILLCILFMAGWLYLWSGTLRD